MAITLDSIANARFMEDLYGKKKHKEVEENIFSLHSDINNEYLNNKDSNTNNLLDEDEEDPILTQSDFSNNIMRLLKNGFGLVESLKETRQQQFEDLFEKRMAENGGDPIEAAAYARARMSSEPTDEEYQSLIAELATEYESINTEIASKLQDYSEKLLEEIEAKNKKIGFDLYEEIEKENKRMSEEPRSNSRLDELGGLNKLDGLNVNFDLQKLMVKNNLEQNLKDMPYTEQEKYHRSIIV